MIKVTALTGSKHDPSSRFRIRQFIAPLKRFGVQVDEYWPLISRYKIEPLPWLVAAMRAPGMRSARSSDVTWLGRELISGRLSLEPKAGKKRVFDVDDAIWLPYQEKSNEDFSADIVKHCVGVIAGNEYLADHYRKLGSKVWLVPTSIDTDIWKPAARTDTDKWTIGWSGSWSNLKFLEAIEEPLADFLAKHLDSRMLVVSDRPPSLKKLPRDSWLYVPWSMQNEVGLVQLMDVGLMPLPDTEWTRGKCGFKALSYMAVGLPVILSSAGNNEILPIILTTSGSDAAKRLRDEVGIGASSLPDWYKALEQLYEDRELAKKMGVSGRQLVTKHYSVEVNVVKLADIFHEVANSGVR